MINLKSNVLVNIENLSYKGFSFINFLNFQKNLKCYLFFKSIPKVNYFK